MMGDYSSFRGLVRGFLWRGRMFNGAVFEHWTARDIPREEAKAKILAVANGDYDPPIYEVGDLESIWKTTGTGKQRDEG